MQSLAAVNFYTPVISPHIYVKYQAYVWEQEHDHDPGKRFDRVMLLEYQIVNKIEGQPQVKEV
jgi:hypothetical protein